MADTAGPRQPIATTGSDNPYNHRSLSYGGHGGKTQFGQHYNIPSVQPVTNASMAFLSQGMRSMGFRDSPYSGQGRDQSINTPTAPYTAAYNLNPVAFWAGNNQMMLANQQHFHNPANAHSSAMYTPHYITNGPGVTHDHSPISQGWTPTHPGAEVPTLITPRRESVSSAENDTPGTPNYPAYHSMPQSGVTILNRSPSGTFTHSTPSPLQMLAQYGMPMTKVPEMEAISPRLKMLVTKEPCIPPAIPAPSSPLKPLDRALENTRGETNVYIRGLMPETSDEMLDIWGRRFGDIKSSKSIIDHSTGLCKG